MTADQIEKKKTIDGINKFMKDFLGSSYVKPPKEAITSGKYRQLSMQQINQAVVALVLTANLSGGSIGGDVDLYKLVRTYLWSDEARTEINTVAGRYGL